ncbi:MAG: TerB family tellurite resistance protein [Spirochaetes bacterium]|nr:TerB family tellurite resistance protein [Spirochaetota bacterium]
MTKNKAVLTVLVGLMAIDEVIDMNEIDEINEFMCKGKYDYNCLDIGIANNLLLLDSEEIEEHFNKAVDFLKDCDKEEKRYIYEYACMVVDSDGILDEGEERLLNKLKNVWGL